MHLLAVGKAAGPMADAWTRTAPVAPRSVLVIAPGARPTIDPTIEWIQAGHPVPDARSVAGGTRALARARGVAAGETLVVLLSGGASALLCGPVDGVSLADKQQASRVLLASGAPIEALNAVRKHLSQIKGGWLATSCAGAVLTLAVSDVVGDSPSVIGSGPTVADPSTFADAAAVIDRWGGRAAYPAAVRSYLARGLAGGAPETPKPGDARLARSAFHIIGGRREALDGARRAAEALGYLVHVIDDPIVGEARAAASNHLAAIARHAARLPRPCCIISGGETTVHVTGHGKGGRNQEFALAAVEALEALGPAAALASIGTDGIDGPTDAAGAIVDTGSAARARAAGLDARQYLDHNDAYAFLDRVGALVRTGPTGTNVGDLQVVMIGA